MKTAIAVGTVLSILYGGAAMGQGITAVEGWTPAQGLREMIEADSDGGVLDEWNKPCVNEMNGERIAGVCLPSGGHLRFNFTGPTGWAFNAFSLPGTGEVKFPDTTLDETMAGLRRAERKVGIYYCKQALRRSGEKVTEKNVATCAGSIGMIAYSYGSLWVNNSTGDATQYDMWGNTVSYYADVPVSNMYYAWSPIQAIAESYPRFQWDPSQWGQCSGTLSAWYSWAGSACTLLGFVPEIGRGGAAVCAGLIGIAATMQEQFCH